jgi:hypothetical protein
MSPKRSIGRPYGVSMANSQILAQTERPGKSCEIPAWCYGNKASPRHVFGKALRSLIPTLRTTGTEAKRTYVGIDLTEEGDTIWKTLLDEKRNRK